MISFLCFHAVDRYNFLVNGEAAKQIQAFLEEEHEFEEYTKVLSLIHI